MLIIIIHITTTHMFNDLAGLSFAFDKRHRGIENLKIIVFICIHKIKMHKYFFYSCVIHIQQKHVCLRLATSCMLIITEQSLYRLVLNFKKRKKEFWLHYAINTLINQVNIFSINLLNSINCSSFYVNKPNLSVELLVWHIKSILLFVIKLDK